MTAPDERTPRPHRLPAPRSRGTAQARTESWFTYDAVGDTVVWSDGLSAMVGRSPGKNEVSRQVLARYVHRDDQATALTALTRAWSSPDPVLTTIRLVRADGGWFDVDCRLDR